MTRIFGINKAQCTHDDSGIPKPSLTLTQQIVSSSCGAMITAFWITPMDVVKIRLQGQGKGPSPGQCFYYHNGLMEHLCGPCVEKQPCEWYQRPGNFTGPIDAIVKISKNEGIRSLWSGLSPTLLSALPATVLYFTMYDKLLANFRRTIKQRQIDGKTHSPMWISPLVAGVMARSFTVCVASPVEMIRTKMQSEHLPLNKLFSVTQATYKTHGIRSLYIGLVPTLYRDVPFSACYWGNVELLKSLLMDYFDKDETTFAISFVSAATSASIATLLTAPFDFIKTRRQISFGTSEVAMNTSTVQMYRDVMHNEGFKTFFVGTTPRLMKVVPACAIMLACYDYAKIFFAHHNEKIAK